MSPKAIVETSLKAGLDLIAVCDHNSAENVGAAKRAGRERGIAVLAGMEISSKEEVHSLALFDTEEQALDLQGLIYRHLKGTNRPEIFGEQVIANEFDEVEGFSDRLLIGAVQLSLSEILDAVHRLGGISIASHVDRPSFSITSQLGFLPEDLPFDALEISRHATRLSVLSSVSGSDRFPMVTFSDAHFPEDIGKAYTVFFLEEATVSEIRMALRGEGGRRFGMMNEAVQRPS
jgi:PHP family Zn ribbon phosphoesterase